MEGRTHEVIHDMLISTFAWLSTRGVLESWNIIAFVESIESGSVVPWGAFDFIHLRLSRMRSTSLCEWSFSANPNAMKLTKEKVPVSAAILT